MEFFLAIIAIHIVIFIIASAEKRADKRKEKQRQDSITKKAEHDLLVHSFKEKRPFKNGLALIKLDDYRWCFMKEDGSFLNNRQLYTSAEEFDNGTAIVGILDGGLNIMDSSGKYLLPPLNDNRKTYNIKRITSDLYSVSISIEHKEGYVYYEYHIYRGDGRRLNKETLSSEPTYSNGWFTVHQGSLTTRIDENGNYETPLFETREEIGDSLFIVSKESHSGRFGLYDGIKNEVILPCKYDTLFFCRDTNTCIVSINTKAGVWEKGKCIIAPKYRNKIIDLSEHTLYDDTEDNMFSVVDGKFILTRKATENTRPCFGAILLDGTEIFKPNYLKIITNDSGTLFFALSDSQCYVADRSGHIVNQYNFIKDPDDLCDTLTNYKHIYPVVYLQLGAHGVIPPLNNTGAFWDTGICSETKDIAIIICSPEGKKGVLSLDNKIIIPTEYDTIEQYDDEDDNPIGVIVKKGNVFGAISISGETILPIEFPSLSYDYASSDSLVVQDDNGCVIQRFTLDGRKYEEVSPATAFLSAIHRRIIQSSEPNPIIKENVSSKPVYLFFDTETTGLPLNFNAPSSDISNWPRIVQLSWILSDNKNNHISSNNFIIKPSGFTIPVSSSSVHGITTEIANRDGVDLSFAINKFLEDFDKCDYIVGHNISFDKKVLGAELIRLGRSDILCSKQSICTMQSSIDYCKIPSQYGYKYPKLQELYIRLFGRSFDDAHDSAADVAATEQCFWEMKDRGLI